MADPSYQYDEEEDEGDKPDLDFDTRRAIEGRARMIANAPPPHIMPGGGYSDGSKDGGWSRPKSVTDEKGRTHQMKQTARSTPGEVSLDDRGGMSNTADLREKDDDALKNVKVDMKPDPAANQVPPVDVKKRALARMQGVTADESEGLDMKRPDYTGHYEDQEAPAAPAKDYLAENDAKVAADKAALAAAQKRTTDETNHAIGSNMIWKGVEDAGGLRHDESTPRARLAAAQQPVQDYMEQRGLETSGLKDTVARQGIAEDQSQDDPANPLAQRAAALAVASGMMPSAAARGFTLRQWKFMNAGADYAQSKAKADQEAADKAANRDVTMRGQDMRLQAEREKNKGDKDLTASGRSSVVLKNLAQLDAAEQDLDRQYAAAKQTGTLAHFVSRIPHIGAFLAPDASATAANAHLLTGTLAGALEGGTATQGKMDTLRPGEQAMSGGTPQANADQIYANYKAQIRNRRNALRAELTGGGLRHGSEEEIQGMIGGGASNGAAPRAGDVRIDPATGRRQVWVP